MRVGEISQFYLAVESQRLVGVAMTQLNLTAHLSPHPETEAHDCRFVGEQRDSVRVSSRISAIPAEVAVEHSSQDGRRKSKTLILWNHFICVNELSRRAYARREGNLGAGCDFCYDKQEPKIPLPKLLMLFFLLKTGICISYFVASKRASKFDIFQRRHLSHSDMV